MTILLMAFLVVILAPLVIPTWRTTAAMLSLQGLLLGWMAFRHRADATLDTMIALTDLVAVRGLLVPLLIYRVMRAQNPARSGDIVPPNMLSWAMAGGMVAISFRFATQLEPSGSEFQTVLAVATSGLLLGLFVLATQPGVFAQAAGALGIENAIALFELGQDERHTPLPIKVGLAGVFLLSACMYVLYVRWLRPVPAEELPSTRSLL